MLLFRVYLAVVAMLLHSVTSSCGYNLYIRSLPRVLRVRWLAGAVGAGGGGAHDGPLPAHVQIPSGQQRPDVWSGAALP
eukprot:1195756-Prorocentrum_minimum.AAC.2